MINRGLTKTLFEINTSVLPLGMCPAGFNLRYMRIALSVTFKTPFLLFWADICKLNLWKDGIKLCVLVYLTTLLHTYATIFSKFQKHALKSTKHPPFPGLRDRKPIYHPHPFPHVPINHQSSSRDRVNPGQSPNFPPSSFQFLPSP